MKSITPLAHLLDTDSAGHTKGKHNLIFRGGVLAQPTVVNFTVVFLLPLDKFYQRQPVIEGGQEIVHGKRTENVPICLIQAKSDKFDGFIKTVRECTKLDMLHGKGEEAADT